MTGILEGKVALVTGGASGLGDAQVRRFASEGAHVTICDVNSLAGEALAKEIGADFRMLDVRNEADFRDAIKATADKYGHFDILVNNAGVARPANPETIEEADLRLMMSVSVEGTVFGCKYALPAMIASGGGSIINIASIASMRGVPYAAGYSAAKGAVEAYTRSVAAHCKLNKLNVRCNSVHPGGFATPMVGATVEELAAANEAGNPASSRLQRGLGDPADLAKLSLFLASDDSRWINGQRFVIDNGDTVCLPEAK